MSYFDWSGATVRKTPRGGWPVLGTKEYMCERMAIYLFIFFFAVGFGFFWRGSWFHAFCFFASLLFAFPASLLVYFSAFLLFAFPAFCFSCFSALPASFLFCFSAFPASLLLCSSYCTLFFSSVMCFAALLPAPLLLCFLSLLPLCFFLFFAYFVS